MKCFFITLLIFLTVSLKAQFVNTGFNHISLSTGLSFVSDNSDFENNLSDNGSHQVANIGYGFAFSVPLRYTTEKIAMTLDGFYDARINENLQINSFMLGLGFDMQLIKREKYQLNFTGGIGELITFFQMNQTEIASNSLIDSLMLIQNTTIKFKQYFHTVLYYGVKNLYLINDNLSIFQSFDFRFQIASSEYYSENGGSFILSKYHINMLNFGIGLQYRIK